MLLQSVVLAPASLGSEVNLKPTAPPWGLQEHGGAQDGRREKAVTCIKMAVLINKGKQGRGVMVVMATEFRI